MGARGRARTRGVWALALLGLVVPAFGAVAASSEAIQAEPAFFPYAGAPRDRSALHGLGTPAPQLELDAASPMNGPAELLLADTPTHLAATGSPFGAELAPPGVVPLLAGPQPGSWPPTPDAGEADEMSHGRWLGGTAPTRNTLHAETLRATPNWFNAAFPVDPTGRGDVSFVMGSWDGIFERYDADGRLVWSVSGMQLACLVPSYSYNQTTIAAGPWGYGLPSTQSLPLAVTREGTSDVLVVSLLVSQREPARLASFVAGLDTADGSVAWHRLYPAVVRTATTAGDGRVALGVEDGERYRAGASFFGSGNTSRVELLDASTGELLSTHDTRSDWGAIGGLDHFETPEGHRIALTHTSPLRGFLSGRGPPAGNVTSTLLVLDMDAQGFRTAATKRMPVVTHWLDAHSSGILWRGAWRDDEGARHLYVGALGMDGRERWTQVRTADVFSAATAVGDLTGDGIRDIGVILFRTLGNALAPQTSGLGTNALSGVGIPPGEGGRNTLLVLDAATGQAIIDEASPYLAAGYVPGKRPLLVLARAGQMEGFERGPSGFSSSWQTEASGTLYHLPVARAADGSTFLAITHWDRPRLVLIDPVAGAPIATHPTTDLVFAAFPVDLAAWEGAELVVGGLSGSVSLVTGEDALAWRVLLDSAVRHIEPVHPDGSLLLVVTDHQSYGVDPERGRVVWEGPRETPAGTQWYAAEFADLNGDGARDAVLSEVGFTPPDARWIVAVDGATGRALWEVAIPGTRGGIAMDLRDLNGDEVPDVAVGFRYDIGQFGSVHALDGRDGSLLWMRLADRQSSINSRATSIRIVDFAGDGAPEVAVVTWDSHFYVMDGRSGATLAYNAMEGYAPVTFDALAVPRDLERAQRAEDLVVLGRMETHLWGSVTAFDAEGNAKWHFRSPVPAFTYQLAAAELDGDDRVDVVVAGGDGVYGILGRRAPELGVRLDLLWSHGSATRLWPHDLDGDGTDELVFAQERVLVPAPVLLFATIDLRTAKGFGILDFDPLRGDELLVVGDGPSRGVPGPGLVGLVAGVGVAAALAGPRRRQ